MAEEVRRAAVPQQTGPAQKHDEGRDAGRQSILWQFSLRLRRIQLGAYDLYSVGIRQASSQRPGG